MRYNWSSLVTTECRVIKIRNNTVYPIFRNGSTSLFMDADTVYTNHEIAGCSEIKILWRRPEDRFVSGLNEYCRQNNLEVSETWKKVKEGSLTDSHFAPQYFWILNLYRFYKETVTLVPFDQIGTLTNKRARSIDEIIPVTVIEEYVSVDKIISKDLMGKSVKIKHIVERYKNELS